MPACLWFTASPSHPCQDHFVACDFCGLWFFTAPNKRKHMAAFTASAWQHLLWERMARIHCQSQYSFWLSKNVGGQTRWWVVWQSAATQTADVTAQGRPGAKQTNGASGNSGKNSQVTFWGWPLAVLFFFLLLVQTKLSNTNIVSS